MKKIIKVIIVAITTCIGRLSTFFFPKKMSKLINKFFRLIYSARHATYIKNAGHRISIGFGTTILNGEYMTIGNDVSIGKRSVVCAWDKYRKQTFTPALYIGDGTSIGDDCHITAINSIFVGKNVLMGKKITITDNSHGKNSLSEGELAPSERNLYSKGGVVISDNVWIGDKVTILPGVHIGTSSIIAANAVVTKDIPSDCIAGGVPAKVLKYLDCN